LIPLCWYFRIYIQQYQHVDTDEYRYGNTSTAESTIIKQQDQQYQHININNVNTANQKYQHGKITNIHTATSISYTFREV
jgi:hypothetical protein